MNIDQLITMTEKLKKWLVFRPFSIVFLFLVIFIIINVFRIDNPFIFGVFYLFIYVFSCLILLLFESYLNGIRDRKERLSAERERDTSKDTATEEDDCFILKKTKKDGYYFKETTTEEDDYYILKKTKKEDYHFKDKKTEKDVSLTIGPSKVKYYDDQERRKINKDSHSVDLTYYENITKVNEEMLKKHNSSGEKNLEYLYAESKGMWICRYCETSNKASKCVVCGNNKA